MGSQYVSNSIIQLGLDLQLTQPAKAPITAITFPDPDSHQLRTWIHKSRGIWLALVASHNQSQKRLSLTCSIFCWSVRSAQMDDTSTASCDELSSGQTAFDATQHLASTDFGPTRSSFDACWTKNRAIPKFIKTLLVLQTSFVFHCLVNDREIMKPCKSFALQTSLVFHCLSDDRKKICSLVDRDAQRVWWNGENES